MPVTGVNPEAAQQLQMQAQAAAQAALAGPSPNAAMSAFDPRGAHGIAARGNNVYMGGLPSAPGAGRPRNPSPTMGDMSNPAMQDALQRKMQSYGVENAQHKQAARRRGA
jgi:hypothetical protein